MRSTGVIGLAMLALGGLCPPLPAELEADPRMRQKSLKSHHRHTKFLAFLRQIDRAY